MGQYYVPIVLGPAGAAKEHIRAWLSPHSFGCGGKLTEHSGIRNACVAAAEYLLCPEGPFWKSRFVWAGDYAEVRPEDDDADPGFADDGTEQPRKNLYHRAYDSLSKQVRAEQYNMSAYPFVVNHTKRLVVDKRACGGVFAALPLLTAEGNGAGGGDYRGADETVVGTWARDEISVERSAPEGYRLVEFEFRE